jgi:hypothetical protein
MFVLPQMRFELGSRLAIWQRGLQGSCANHGVIGECYCGSILASANCWLKMDVPVQSRRTNNTPISEQVTRQVSRGTFWFAYFCFLLAAGSLAFLTVRASSDLRVEGPAGSAVGLLFTAIWPRSGRR